MHTKFDEVLGTFLGSFALGAFLAGFIAALAQQDFWIGAAIGFWTVLALWVAASIWCLIDWSRGRRKFRAKTREAKARRELYYGKGA